MILCRLGIHSWRQVSDFGWWYHAGGRTYECKRAGCHAYRFRPATRKGRNPRWM